MAESDRYFDGGICFKGQTYFSGKGASVFQMQSRNHFVSEHYDEHTSILFVDGMGIEYVDYLAHLFSDLDEQQYSVFFDAEFAHYRQSQKSTKIS